MYQKGTGHGIYVQLYVQQILCSYAFYISAVGDITTKHTTSFFEQYGRKLFKMVCDGNCFYHEISYQLFGAQEKHCTIHSVVSHVKTLTRRFFHLTSYQDGINPQSQNKSAMLVLLVLELHIRNPCNYLSF